ncbi:tail completion protein gp17 [Salinicola sp. V024]|uniref:tail completion protein gp17 n=1 Tax=Salinicola sp. V024 TaxID=3459609 RepID=UPI004044A012
MLTDFYVRCAQSEGFKLLLNDSDDKTSSDDLRIYPVVAPEGVAYPYIVYNTITSNPFNVLKGKPVAEAVSVQVDIYAKDYVSCLMLAQVLREELIDQCYMQLNLETFDDETKSYRISHDLDFITSTDFR